MILGVGLQVLIALLVIYVIIAIYLLKSYGSEAWVAPVLFILLILIAAYPLITVEMAKSGSKLQNTKVIVDNNGIYRVVWVVLGAFFGVFAKLAKTYFEMIYAPYSAENQKDAIVAADGQPESPYVRVWRVPLKGTVSDRVEARALSFALRSGSVKREE
eukprot:PhF_6_TR35172/c0_g1_i1/m.51239